MQLLSLVSVQPPQPMVTVTFGDNSAEKKREQLVEEQLRDPDNAKRNPLRADALQAATGFALSPCNKTMKANLVVATPLAAFSGCYTANTSIAFESIHPSRDGWHV